MCCVCLARSPGRPEPRMSTACVTYFVTLASAVMCHTFQTPCLGLRFRQSGIIYLKSHANYSSPVEFSASVRNCIQCKGAASP